MLSSYTMILIAPYSPNFNFTWHFRFGYQLLISHHSHHNAKAQNRAKEQFNQSCRSHSPEVWHQVSRELSIPSKTLRNWRKASIASGNCNGGAGDNKNVVARPAPRKKEPGTGTGCQLSWMPRGGPPCTESCSEYFLSSISISYVCL